MIPAIIMLRIGQEKDSELTACGLEEDKTKASFRRLAFAIPTGSDHEVDGKWTAFGLRSSLKTAAMTVPASIPSLPEGNADRMAVRICSSLTAAMPSEASPSRISAKAGSAGRLALDARRRVGVEGETGARVIRAR
jgi:hypothetical protein